MSCNLLQVSQIMRPASSLALLEPGATVLKAIQAMTLARTGAAVVVSETGTLQGIFTHGDFARHYPSCQDIGTHPVEEFMTRSPVTIPADKLAADAVAAARSDDGASLSKSLAARQATGTMLQLLACLYVDALTIAIGADRSLVHADQADAVAAAAEHFTPTQLAEIIEQLGEFERMLWQNVNPRIVWDNVVITCASAAPLRV